jgi:ABC-2 type transport system ATP-binding protein
MDAKSLIAVKDLHRSFGSKAAVRDVSFVLKPGEVLGFLGPNGAGKSTTMQIISGALAPSSGQVLVNGLDLFDQPKAAKAELGYLPERPPLYPELTVDEYLRFCARLHGMRGGGLGNALSAAKARCGLEGMGGRLIANLSKGFQQRVGLAQAIIHDPRVVILDEPTVGLDPIQILEIRRLIRGLGDTRGVILSTHLLPEVQAVCDRVQIIHEGRLVLNESLDHLNDTAAHQCFRIGFRQRPPPERLHRLPGVTRVELLGTNYARLHVKANPAIADALVADSVREGWRLFELTPERRSLEEIFVELTCGESSRDGKRGSR